VAKSVVELVGFARFIRAIDAALPDSPLRLNVRRWLVRRGVPKNLFAGERRVGPPGLVAMKMTPSQIVEALKLARERTSK
jgi:hypothetical protein